MRLAIDVADLLRVLSRVLLYITLIACLLFLGSVNTIPFQTVAILAFSNAVLAGLAHGEPQETRWLFRLSLLGCATLCLWVWCQSLPLFSQPLGTELWRQAQRAASPGPYAISLVPADTREALPRLALPFIVFATTLAICRSDRRAMGVLRILAMIGGGTALFGLGQFLFFRDMLLLDQKRFYLESLTGVFVNRNTAATFFGLTVMLLLVLLWESVRRWTRAKFSLQLLLECIAGRIPGGGPSFVYFLLLVCAFTALMLTKSRGGVAATALGLLFLVPYLVANFSEEPHPARRRRGRGRILATLGGCLALVMVIGLFSGQAMLRAEQLGLDDPRFCVAPGIVRLAADSWPLGAGPGSFTTAFSAYHDPKCGIMQLWDRAHNVFAEGLIALGFVFPLLALPVLAALFKTLSKGLRERRRLRHYPALGLAGLLLVLAHSLIDFSLMIPGFALFFATFLGAVAAICCNRQTTG